MCPQAEDAFRQVDVALGSYRARIGALEAQVRGRDADVARLHKLLEQSRGAEVELEAKQAKVRAHSASGLSYSRAAKHMCYSWAGRCGLASCILIVRTATACPR